VDFDFATSPNPNLVSTGFDRASASPTTLPLATWDDTADEITELPSIADEGIMIRLSEPYMDPGSISPSPEILDPRSRELFDHFSTHIAPIMVIVDSVVNGYRSLILPLAFEEPMVKEAVCVASLYHLASRQPENQRRADIGLQNVLAQLRNRASLKDSLLDVPAWSTLIILLTAETVSGGTNLHQLFRLLLHLATANATTNQTSVMHSFLAEQTRMMTFLARPLLGEAGEETASSQVEGGLDFISNQAIFQPALADELSIYMAAFSLAASLYATRASQNPRHEDTVVRVDELKGVCEQIYPSSPGRHALVWVYFIGAAESSVLRHRQFFTTQLQSVFEMTHFNNIPAALQALQEIWKIQRHQRWTEILPRIMPIFII
jgi:hypothetical protein